MIRRLLHLLTLAVLGAFTAPQVHAVLLAEEEFAYPAGSLTGQTGGTGWSAGWTASGTGSTISSPGFAYTDGLGTVMPVSGNKANFVDGNNGNFRIPAISPDAVGTTLYISFLAQMTATGGYAGLSLHQAGGENLFLGKPTGQTTWGIDLKGAGVPVSTVPSTTLSLLVYRIDFAVSTVVSLYVNPTLGTEPAVASASGARTAFLWDNIRIQSGNGGVGAIDQIRIGTDYASVAVPEPGSATLLAAGLLPLLRRRRSEHDQTAQR